MPTEIVTGLNKEIHEILADPKVIDMFTAIGAAPTLRRQSGAS